VPFVTESDHEWAVRLRASGLPVPDPQPADPATARKPSPGEKIALTICWMAFVAAQVLGSVRDDFGHLTAPAFGVVDISLLGVASCALAIGVLIAWRESRKSRR
jgi:hypothetical protein